MPEDDTPHKIEVTTGASNDYTGKTGPITNQDDEEFANQNRPQAYEPKAADPVPPKKSRKKLIVTLLLLVILIGGAAAWYFLIRDKPVTSTAVPVKVAEQKKPDKTETPPEQDPVLEKFINPTTGETWLAKSKPLPKQGYYAVADNEQSTEYFEVGKRGGKTIIMSVISQIGDFILIYEKSPDGSLTLIAHPDGEAVYNQDYDNFTDLKPNIKIDKNIHYDSLTLPRKLKIDQGYTLTKSQYPSLGNLVRPADPVNDQKVAVAEVKKLGQSSLKRNERQYIDTKLTAISYSVTTPINTSVSLGYQPLETDLGSFQWQTGNSPSDKIHAISRGCGGLNASVTRSDIITEKDVQQVGKSDEGVPIYELKDQNNPLFQKAYQEFKEYAGSDTTVPYASISKAEFAKEHAVILYKDKFNQWLVYVRDQLAASGGCAKPVVYLYPETPQKVTVKVGAHVKISEPLYNPDSGWNTFAFPSGKLIVNNNWYDSLFWEGPGFGQYPAIESGTVVARKDAVITIEQQLIEQGMNIKEIADFLVYWEDKLPNTAYVRLTWLSTAELNELAPLHITPKPDTVIRVFLDFEGLDKPLAIPGQKLSSIPRKGFTVTEWGGLSHTKLY